MKDKLTNEEVLLLNSEVARREKNPVVVYLLALFMGTLGIHRLYMGKTGSGIAMMLMTLLSLGLLVIVTGIWSFVDLFLIGGWLKEDKLKLESAIVPEIIARRA